MLKPLQSKVIVKRDTSPNKTPGGIVIPEQAKERLTQGTVLAVGPGRQEPSKLAAELETAWKQHCAHHPWAAGTKLAKTIAGLVRRLRRIAPTVAPGDRVLFGKYTGNDARVRDEQGVEQDCVLCDEEELYGVIE